MATIHGLLSEKRRYLRLAVLRETLEFLTSDSEAIDEEAAALGLGRDEIERAWGDVADMIDRKLMAAREPILSRYPLDALQAGSSVTRPRFVGS